VFRNIVKDPTSDRVRQLRIKNPKFKEQIGRWKPAVALLRTVGFVKGDYWVSAFERELCLEFRLPVDSDNPKSKRFVCAYSLIDEVVRAPDEWLPMVLEALPEVQSEWARESDWATAACEDLAEPVTSADGNSATSGGPSRAYIADLHERRARDPRAFAEAMRAAGKQPNKTFIDVRPVAATGEDDGVRSGAQRLASAAASSSSRTTPGYRRLSERYPGRRDFNLSDIEAMRVEDAIAGTPQYAREYDLAKGSANTVSGLVNRMYDPQYLGRKAVDDSNIFRGEQKMPPMRWSQALADIAAEHARQMARGEMPFSHKGFDDRVRRYPFPYMSAAENLAYNSGVADAAGQAVQGWIKSPGHRKNLLGAFDLCGVGVAQSSSGQFFFTQLLARTYGALC